MNRSIPDGDAARQAKRRTNIDLARSSTSVRTVATTSGEPIELVCECRLHACSAEVWMTEADFRMVSAKQGSWLVAPGHEDADERVVATSRRYMLVREPAAQH